MERSAILCPWCGAIESPKSSACHRCGRELKARVIDATPLMKRLAVRKDLATLSLSFLFLFMFSLTGILAIQNGGSLAESVAPGAAYNEALGELGAIDGLLILGNGEWWRLGTAIFLHGGLLHLLFNFMALRAVGFFIEESLGTLRYATMFLLSGVVANVISLFLHGPSLRQVGASGAICALVGAMYVIALRRTDSFGQLLRQTATKWIIMTVLFGLMVPQVVDNAAHIAGLLAGAAFTKFLLPGRKPGKSGWVA